MKGFINKTWQLWLGLALGAFLGIFLTPPQDTVAPTKLPSEAEVEQGSVLGTQTQKQDDKMTESADQQQSVLLNHDLVYVKRVIDGDTIELEDGQKVRYLGIDAPELDGQEKVACYGQAAGQFNAQLVDGKLVALVIDVSDKDRYGRLLRYVFLPDGRLVNELIVAAGFARVATYPPDVKYQNRFLIAERKAREAKRGLWSGTCEQLSSTRETTESKSSNCQIKGNINLAGEKIYHLPGCQSYNQTVINESRGERWFCSEEEARQAGWRKAKNCL